MVVSVREQLRLGLEYDASEQAELRDAAAAENKALPVHRWVPWIAGFSAQFVADAIDAYLPAKGRENQVVLDPFAGVGTTLLEALKAGRHAVGHEINPYAALAARAKVHCVDITPRAFARKVNSFRERLSEFEAQVDRAWSNLDLKTFSKLSAPFLKMMPKDFRSRIPFFSEPVEAKFLYALHHVTKMREPYRDLFRAALGATMVSFSNYTYEPSLSSRPGAGKPLIDNASVTQAISAKLEIMREDIDFMISQFGTIWRTRRRYVDETSYFESRLAPNSASLLVTSPPYLNNYHYVRNTRPQLHWLGLISGRESLRTYERTSFGKFWQTVRQGPAISPNVASRTVRQLVHSLRGVNVERGAYGGPGWANYVATYFDDCERFLLQAKRHLRPGSRAVVVVGNSIIQGIEIRVDQVLAELAESRGLMVEEIRVVRAKRVGNSIIDSSVRNGNGIKHKTQTQLYDAAVVLKR